MSRILRDYTCHLLNIFWKIWYSPEINIFVYVCEYTLEYFNTLDNCFVECNSIFLSKIIQQIKPIKVYDNFKNDRLDLIKDQKDRAGVYCLVNLTNGNIYIGSSINLGVRMRNYLNTTFLKNREKIAICLLQSPY